MKYFLMNDIENLFNVIKGFEMSMDEFGERLLTNDYTLKMKRKGR